MRGGWLLLVIAATGGIATWGLYDGAQVWRDRGHQERDVAQALSTAGARAEKVRVAIETVDQEEWFGTETQELLMNSVGRLAEKGRTVVDTMSKGDHWTDEQRRNGEQAREWMTALARATHGWAQAMVLKGEAHQAVAVYGHQLEVQVETSGAGSTLKAWNDYRRGLEENLQGKLGETGKRRLEQTGRTLLATGDGEGLGQEAHRLVEAGKALVRAHEEGELQRSRIEMQIARSDEAIARSHAAQAILAEAEATRMERMAWTAASAATAAVALWWWLGKNGKERRVRRGVTLKLRVK